MKTKAEITVERSEFSLVSQFWKEHLWPLRTSPIEPISWIDSDGKINLRLKLGLPSFFVASNQDMIIGVVSGYRTSGSEFRSRGIWVSERNQKLGVGRKLMNQVIQQAKIESCKTVWTMPRQSAKEFYIRLGFKETKTVEGYEYGPHTIAKMSLDDKE